MISQKRHLQHVLDRRDTRLASCYYLPKLWQSRPGRGGNTIENWLGSIGRKGAVMARANIKHLGTLPNAYGTLTRLAYAHAKAAGIDTRTLLEKANLTLQQINDTALKLRVRDQSRCLDLVTCAHRDNLFGFHLAQPLDLREFGFLYYVAASSKELGEALQKLARYSKIANEGVSVR